MGNRASRVQDRHVRATLTERPGHDRAVNDELGAEHRDSGSRRRSGITAVVALYALAVVGLDQLTKWWALEALGDGEVVSIVWTLQLRLVENTGTAFSLGEGSGSLIAVLAIVVVLGLLWAGRTIDSALGALALGLLLGGAVGNLLDRLFRAGDGLFDGAVIDFVDLQWWPVFNLADSAIVIGGGLLVLNGFRGRAAPEATG